MSDVAVGSIDVGSPHATGDNWQFGVRPAESLDAANVEIVNGPDDAASAGSVPADED